MSVVEGLTIQIHVCGTYVLSVKWFILLIGSGSVWIFFRIMRECEMYYIEEGNFTPLAFLTSGGIYMSNECKKFINRLANLQARRNVEEYGGFGESSCNQAEIFSS